MQTEGISLITSGMPNAVPVKNTRANDATFDSFMAKHASRVGEVKTDQAGDRAEKAAVQTPVSSGKPVAVEKTMSKDSATRLNTSVKDTPGSGQTVQPDMDPEMPETIDLSMMAEQVMDVMQEIFGLPEEDLLDIMEQLGIEIQDLLFRIQDQIITPVDAEAIQQLVMGVHGIADEAAFLTNEQLADEMSQMQDGLTEILSETLGVEPEDLNTVSESLMMDFSEQFTALTSQTVKADGDQALPVQPTVEMPVNDMLPEEMPVEEIPVETMPTEEILPEEIPVEEIPVEEIPLEEMPAQQTLTTEKPVAEKAAAEISDIRKAPEQSEPLTVVVEDQRTGSETNLTADTEIPDVNAMSGRENTQYGSGNFDGESDGDQQELQGQQVSTETISQVRSDRPEMSANLFVERLAEAFRESGRADEAQAVPMARIVQQVVNQIRIRVMPQTTDMELQLHPASLGRVNLHVSAANGVATATMIVESQMAKEALESQMITLQESFREQGLKVDSVEVIVSEFGLDQREKQGEQSEPDRKNHRFRQDAGTEGDSEEPLDAVETARERRDVNSVVDYTA